MKNKEEAMFYICLKEGKNKKNFEYKTLGDEEDFVNLCRYIAHNIEHPHMKSIAALIGTFDKIIKEELKNIKNQKG